MNRKKNNDIKRLKLGKFNIVADLKQTIRPDVTG